MSVDRTKVLDSAQKYLSKGQYDKAINEYRKLVKQDSRDVRTWLKIGDLYARKGSKPEAVRTYTRVAEQYAEDQFYLKAVAVYKRILQLDPGRLDASVRLAKMYENLELISDALATYETVSAAYAQSGKIDLALATLNSMCELDPDNIPIHIKYAEALSKAGRAEGAADAFERGANLLRDQGRLDDYIKVAERLLYHRPTDAETALALAECYLERRDAKRALAKLKVAFEANPKDVRTLNGLVNAFQLLGQTGKAVSVYREIARTHLENGDHQARAQALQSILQINPGDLEARQALGTYAQPEPEPPAPPAAPDPVFIDDDDDDDIDIEILDPDDDDDLGAAEADFGLPPSGAHAVEPQQPDQRNLEASFGLPPSQPPPELTYDDPSAFDEPRRGPAVYDASGEPAAVLDVDDDEDIVIIDDDDAFEVEDYESEPAGQPDAFDAPGAFSPEPARADYADDFSAAESPAEQAPDPVQQDVSAEPAEEYPEFADIGDDDADEPTMFLDEFEDPSDESLQALEAAIDAPRAESASRPPVGFKAAKPPPARAKAEPASAPARVPRRPEPKAPPSAATPLGQGPSKAQPVREPRQAEPKAPRRPARAAPSAPPAVAPTGKKSSRQALEPPRRPAAARQEPRAPEPARQEPVRQEAPEQQPKPRPPRRGKSQSAYTQPKQAPAAPQRPARAEPKSTHAVMEAAAPSPPVPAAPPSQAAPALSGDVARDAQIARLLTECDVFMRYGLQGKVVEQLAKVLQLDPNHFDARERLKDLYIELNDIDAAKQQLEALILLSAANQVKQAELKAELLTLAAAPPPPPAPAPEPEPEPEPAPAPIAAPAEEDDLVTSFTPDANTGSPSPAWQDGTAQDIPDAFPDFDDDPADRTYVSAAPDLAEITRQRAAAAAAAAAEQADVLEAPPAASVEPTLSQPDPSPLGFDELEDDLLSLPPMEDLPPMDAVDEIAPSQTYVETRNIDEIVAEHDSTAPPGGTAENTFGFDSPPVGPALSGSDGLPDFAATVDPQTNPSGQLPVEHLPADIPAQAPPVASAPPSAAVSLRPSKSPSAGDIEDALDEADFFMAQGMMEDARMVLTDTLSAHPDHPLLLERLAEASGTATALSNVPSIEEPDHAFQLAERLAEELESAPPEAAAEGSNVIDVESVFAQFKRGVEAQIGTEDSETHFDLGIAYKEMALMSDAIDEFKLATRSPERECSAHTMIGMCYVELGQFMDAVSHFKKGLYAQQKTDGEELGLYYELGRAYDLLDDPSEALYYLRMVQSRDPSFRGVADRITALEKRTSQSEFGTPSVDEVDRAFDDLLRDGD